MKAPRECQIKGRGGGGKLDSPNSGGHQFSGEREPRNSSVAGGEGSCGPGERHIAPSKMQEKVLLSRPMKERRGGGWKTLQAGT